VEAGLVPAGDCLDPAERFLNALADTLADGIAAVPRRASVDRRASALKRRNVVSSVNWQKTNAAKQEAFARAGPVIDESIVM
jgi:hypothetical protein